MKTVLYMGITPNGYIARENGDSEWTSDEDLQGFYEKSKECGNIIMGKNTFHEAMRQGYFPFPDALNVVVTHGEVENRWGDNVLVTAEEPEGILKLLETRGYETAFLAGGGKLNASFAQKGLIDEIYLDIEPLLFGKGIDLFADKAFECKLELVDTKQLNKDTLQVHYKVV